MTEEEVYFSEGEVQVTSTRLQTETTMYPVNGITAVSLVDVPKNYTPGLAVVGIGIGVGLLGVNMGSAILVVGLGFLALGVVILVLARKKWAVAIGTAGGQQHAVVSTDRAYVERIVQALNDAVTRRG